MKVRTAGILLLAGLSAPCAVAAEREYGGKISLGYGFKPEFVESDGAGKYAVVTGKLSMITDKTWSLSLEQSLKATEHPEKKAAMEDPLIRLSLPTEAIGLSVTYGLMLSPGLSRESRDADYFLAIRPGLTVIKPLGIAYVGVGASTTRHVRKYTRTTEGTASTTYSLSGSLLAGIELGKVSLDLSLTYRESTTYEGPKKFGYVNELSFEHHTTKELSFELGLSTSDTQQAADGTDINEFSFYRQNKTEAYLGANYAL